MISTTNDKITMLLNNIFSCYGFSQCINEYTRVQGASRTIIDNIFTNFGISSANVFRYPFV